MTKLTPTAPTADEFELLKLAAKAGGFFEKLKWDNRGFSWYDPPKHWNPLVDDGDALRLAVDLGMLVDVRGGKVLCATIETHFVADQSIDLHAAARHTIVRVAAAIGKTIL